MFIETKFEMHTHNSKIVTTIRQSYIERRIAISLLEKSENSFRVSENILRANKASHGSFNAHNGCFSADGS